MQGPYTFLRTHRKMETNGLLHILHQRLTAFEEEEKVLGRHRALDERFAAVVIRTGKELYELADKNPRYKEDPSKNIYTISLFRDGEYVTHEFKAQPLISKTPWPQSSVSPDSEGYTWFMCENVSTDSQQRIFLNKHDGPFLWYLVYDYGR